MVLKENLLKTSVVYSFETQLCLVWNKTLRSESILFKTNEVHDFISNFLRYNWNAEPQIHTETKIEQDFRDN